jgi:hypothetical protein
MPVTGGPTTRDSVSLLMTGGRKGRKTMKGKGGKGMNLSGNRSGKAGQIVGGKTGKSFGSEPHGAEGGSRKKGKSY